MRKRHFLHFDGLSYIAAWSLVCAQGFLLSHAQQTNPSATANSASSIPADVLANLTHLESDLKSAQAAKHPLAAAKALDSIGKIYFDTSQYEKATDSYSRALIEARVAKDLRQEAAALVGIADCNNAVGQVQKALDGYRQALDLSRSSGDRLGEATALNGLGWGADNLGQLQQALDFHNRALELAQSLNAPGLEATILRRIGIVYSGQSNFPKALDFYTKALAIFQHLGDYDGQARTLNNIGVVYYGQGKSKEALDYYLQALPLYRRAGDRANAATTLVNMAGVYATLSQTPQAFDYYTQAAAAYREINNRIGEAKALQYTGTLFDGRGDKDKALDYYGRSLAIFQELGDNDNIAATLTYVGLLHYGQKDNQKALNEFNLALSAYRQAGDKSGETNGLNNIASVYSAEGEKQKALDAYNQALPLYRQAKDHDGEARILHNIGIAYHSLQDEKRSLASYLLALAAYRQAGSQAGEASVLHNIGVSYDAQGESQQAFDSYSQSLLIYRKLNDQSGEALALYGIGCDYRNLGEKQKALDYLDQAHSIYQRIANRDMEAMAMLSEGAVYTDLGEEQKALGIYTEVLPIFREISDRASEAKALENIGFTYSDLGDQQKALDYFNQTLTIDRQIGDRDDEARTLNNIGGAYSDRAERQKALEDYTQALQIDREIGDRIGETRSLGNIGNTYSDMGKPDKALEYYMQVLPAFRELGDQNGEARALDYIGTIYQLQGDKQKAISSFNQALPIALAIQDPVLSSRILTDLMSSQKADQPGLATFYGKEAVNYIQQVRGKIMGLDKELQASFLATKKDVYQGLANLLIDQGRLPEAQQVLDLLKQQEYTDYVRGEKVDPAEQLALTPAELEAEQDYQKSTVQLVSLSEQWSGLRKLVSRSSEQEAQYQQLSAQLDQASKDLNSYYARLYVLFGKDSEANKQVADVKGDVSLLRQTIAKMPHTVALYTLVGKDRTSIIVITGGTAVARESAISEKDLNQLVSDFQQVLRNPSRDPKPAASELYKALILPIQADLDQARAETLVWSLDGVLRYIPMAALYDGKQYLVARYSTVTITPASIPHLSEKPDIGSLSVAAMGISSKYEENLPALPAVVGELEDVVNDPQVQAAHGVLPGTILLNGEFTEKAMESALGGRHTVVHIASHFVFKPGDDNQSYLLLASADKGNADYHLTVADFRDNQNIDLESTDLLTLSACDTGMSSNAGNGREVDGLGTTAQLKGAKAVISSLWEVNDSSTGQLMAGFYRRWSAGGGKVTKVEALREAQLDLLQGRTMPEIDDSNRGFEQDVQAAPRNFSHPYYWAPFILMGNWR